MKVGDFVQYRNAFGVVVGYGILTEITEAGWYIVRDNVTNRREHWSEHLLYKIS